MLNELATRLPELRLTIRCGLPLDKLRARISAEFTHIAGRTDFGFVMLDAVSIDLSATAQAYRAQHADWAQRVANEAQQLEALAPHLVLTDVAYLPLAGAARAGIPAFGMCSLNWGELFAHFFAHEPWAPPIQAQIDAAYAGAPFLRLTPAMPMPRLAHSLDLPPVAVPGRARPAELRAALGCAADVRLALVAFGGFAKALPLEDWPEQNGLRILIPGLGQNPRPDVADPATLDFSFSDLLASVDAVLTKPGYGTFSEAACNGTPVLYVRRENWPEQDCLLDWLQLNARAEEISEAKLKNGDLQAALTALWQQPAPPMPRPDGAAEAATIIAGRLTAARDR